MRWDKEKNRGFGIISASVGAIMAALNIIFGTNDLPMMVASTILVIAGFFIWVINK